MTNPTGNKPPTPEPERKPSVDLLRKMSHDMRSPLNSIIGTSDMLLEGIYGDVDQKQERAVRRVQRNGRRLLALVDDMMIYVKTEFGEYPLSPAPFEPQALLKEIVDELSPYVAEKALTVEINGAELLPTALLGDRAAVKKVISALIWNALVFTSSGSVAVTSRWADAEGWTVQVKDSGGGIQAEALPRIFEAFYRSEGSPPDGPSSGSGLGLAMAQGLSKHMGGTLTLETTSAQGSTFLVKLPLKAAAKT